MNRTTIALALLAGISTAAPAMADLNVVGSSGASWQAFPGTLNNYSNAHRPFWDQDTMDRAGSVTNRNIGNYLNNTYTGSLPGGAAPSPNITPAWWGKSTSSGFRGSMDNNVGFALTAPSTQVASTMRLEVAGYSPHNVIGWYDLNDPVGAENLNVIYNGAASAGAAVTFVPTVAFGLYIRTGGNQLFFSQSHRNRAIGGPGLDAEDLTTQHFAIFQASGVAGAQSYVIGVEDLAVCNAGREVIGDYNDLVFTLTAVPSPSAAALIGLGGLAAGRRRRR